MVYFWSTTKITADPEMLSKVAGVKPKEKYNKTNITRMTHV